MMVKDHSAAGDQLKKIAQARNINISDSLSSDSKKHVADMQKKKGKDFDKAYMKMMVEGHTKVLKQFEDEQSKGADAELKAFASQTVPTIKGHLDSAKSIRESLK
jgi:putative membrane protein